MPQPTDSLMVAARQVAVNMRRRFRAARVSERFRHFSASSEACAAELLA
jgi:hypothetical protein